MPRRWTIEEEYFYRGQLNELYVIENKTIFEVGEVLGVSPQTVFDRLRRLGIPTAPERKYGYLNTKKDIVIPAGYSDDLAEFFGIMLGDGHVSHSQVMVTLGTKELDYARYVARLFWKLFGVFGSISVRENDYRTVYIGSVELSHWFQENGLVSNKVKSQVDVPTWIFTKYSYMKRFFRGFFDTDGSVYELRYGIQLSLTNGSRPLLKSLQRVALALGYKASAISGQRFYLTKIADIKRFFREIGPQNKKHANRFLKFWKRYCEQRVGTQVVNEGGL